MKDLGMMHYVLGMEVWTREVYIRDPKEDYKAMTTPMASNLKVLSVASSKSVDATMYRQMIGSLMYQTNTRPDICFVVNTLRHVHLMISKHVVRYLKGTAEYGLKYDTNQKINLEGYVDSDWVGSAIDRKSTSGCCFSMGARVISWFSRKQSCMALSTAEAKYVATCSAICEVVCFF